MHFLTLQRVTGFAPLLLPTFIRNETCLAALLQLKKTCLAVLLQSMVTNNCPDD
jgi:hypothetical protein